MSEKYVPIAYKTCFITSCFYLFIYFFQIDATRDENFLIRLLLHEKCVKQIDNKN